MAGKIVIDPTADPADGKAAAAFLIAAANVFTN